MKSVKRVKHSPNAQAVAREVIATIKRGEKVVKGKIIAKHGYSKAVSKNVEKVTNTQSYKLEIARTIEQLEVERDRAICLLPKKIGSAKYHQLVSGIDTLTKNIQLLSGNSTSNQAILIHISEEIANKNNSD